MRTVNYQIRELMKIEYPLLEDFLYEAIFQKDAIKLPKSIIKQPELQIYIKDFGKLPHDQCFCATLNSKPIGAVWVRIIPGFGSINDSTPEFAISVYPKYRGLGIGRALMTTMLTTLKNQGYKAASLSVQKDNYAFNLYISLGFQIIDENLEECLMIHYL